MMLHHVNADPGLQGPVDPAAADTVVPVLATPTALVAVPAAVKVTAAAGVAAAAYVTVNK